MTEGRVPERPRAWPERLRRRPVLLAIAGVAAIVTACGPEAAQQRAGRVECSPVGDRAQPATVLMAQAVPSATLLPCVATTPAGWSLSGFEAVSGAARLWFDSDRAGARALEVVLVPACEPLGTPTPSDEPGARLWTKIDGFEPRFHGTRYYRFAGACMMERFDLPPTGATVLITDIAVMVDLAPRASLDALLAGQGLHL